MRERGALFVLLIAAAILMAPSLMLGTLISHSSPQNLTWAAQFADQFRAGILYPRFLPDSFDGLGGPAFYFYPPIAFWLDGLLNIATFDALSVSYRLSLSSWLLLWASGVAMYLWLASETAPRAALYGALGYMAAPYHLVDHYYRGAYAEFAAYAVLPLVALAVRRTAEGRRWGPLLLAVSYAALPMAHLPTSLLISLTALPMYVLYRGWRLGAAGLAACFFLRCAIGGALGLGLAAIYLVPALTLQDWIPAEAFWAGDYRIDKWFLLTPQRWPVPTDMMWIIACCALAHVVAAIGVVVLSRGGTAKGLSSEATFWAGTCLLCILLISGLLPWFWQVPFVAKVQFPWRLMIVVEFAAITALCLGPWSARRRAMSYLFVACILVFLPALAILGPGIRLRIEVSLVERETPADLKQFLPAAYPQKPSGGYAELSLDPLQGTPLIVCAPTPAICRATPEPFGALRVEIEAAAPTTVVLRRFAFPVWQLDPLLPIVATDPLQLVSFTAPAGTRAYRLKRVPVLQEKIGWAISGLAFLVLLASCAILGRRARGRPWRVA